MPDADESGKAVRDAEEDSCGAILIPFILDPEF